uniref:Uncharacterized protein n=1 Tax=Eptatretus burgeri TaxID=7764 RepID=A0A8C4QET3_EPTBU
MSCFSFLFKEITIHVINNIIRNWQFSYLSMCCSFSFLHYSDRSSFVRRTTVYDTSSKDTFSILSPQLPDVEKRQLELPKEIEHIIFQFICTFCRSSKMHRSRQDNPEEMEEIRDQLYKTQTHFRNFKEVRERVIAEMRLTAHQLQKATEDANVTKIAGLSTGIIGGAAGLTALAVGTGGIALPLVLGIGAGTVGSLTAANAESSVREKERLCSEGVIRMLQKDEQYSKKLKEEIKKLDKLILDTLIEQEHTKKEKKMGRRFRKFLKRKFGGHKKKSEGFAKRKNAHDVVDCVTSKSEDAHGAWGDEKHAQSSRGMQERCTSLNNVSISLATECVGIIIVNAAKLAETMNSVRSGNESHTANWLRSKASELDNNLKAIEHSIKAKFSALSEEFPKIRKAMSMNVLDL